MDGKQVRASVEPTSKIGEKRKEKKGWRQKCDLGGTCRQISIIWQNGTPKVMDPLKLYTSWNKV